jgi:hypothetical protein
VVFHRNGSVEEIPPADENNSLSTQNLAAVKVREGDVVLYVYRGLRAYHLAGTVSTKDNYKRVYEIDLLLEVKHALPLARMYYREEDPVREALSEVKLWFEWEARSVEYNRLPGWGPEFDRWNADWLSHYGIAIRPNNKALFREDPHFSDIERVKNEFARKTLERNFARQEEIRDQIHRICSDMLQVAANEMKDTLQERVREGFEKGQLTSEIWDDLYKVISAIGDDDRQIKLEQQMTAQVEATRQTNTSPITESIKRNTAEPASNGKSSLDTMATWSQ